MKILISGGAGYIGSIIAGVLRKEGHGPIILDSLSGGERPFNADCPFYHGDMADPSLLKRIIREQGIPYAAVHCAALTIVPESTEQPARYYRENVAKTLDFFGNLRSEGCRRILLSGSASVYGRTTEIKLGENTPPAPESPYARTKIIQEYILEDLCRSEKENGLRGMTLRYFNPLGAAPDLSAGPWKKEGTHLIARLLSHSPRNPFVLTGTDFATKDGTGIRDYFHVADLALAHLAVLEDFDAILSRSDSPYLVMNAGSGRGISVREFIHAYEEVTGKQVDYLEGPPRPGDVAGGYADTERISGMTGWKPRYTLEEAIESAVAWEKKENHRGVGR